MKKLLIIVLTLTISLYAGAKPYLNNVGGTYKRVTDYKEIKANDILIFASHSSLNGEDKVRIMTTVSTKYTGRFGYYTYGEYVNAMPATITLSEVNSEGKPYEYVVTFGKTGKTTQELYLQNIDKKYITGDEEKNATKTNNNAETLRKSISICRSLLCHASITPKRGRPMHEGDD